MAGGCGCACRGGCGGKWVGLVRVNVLAMDGHHHVLGWTQFDIAPRTSEHEFGRLYAVNGSTPVPIRTSGTVVGVLLYVPDLHQRWWKSLPPVDMAPGVTLWLSWEGPVLTITVDGAPTPSTLRIDVADNQQPEVLQDALRRFLG